MKLELVRVYLPGGTNGTIFLNGKKVCSSIELPWKNNEPRISCIPEGEYALRKRYSPKFKEHLLLEDVPGRSLILIHPANDALKELKGCIAPVTTVTGEGKGTASRAALKELLQLISPVLKKGEPIFLHIQQKKDEKYNCKACEAPYSPLL